MFKIYIENPEQIEMKSTSIFLIFAITFANAVDVDDRTDHMDYIISLQQNGKHFCAGVIFNLDNVLTSASCVVGKRPDEITIVSATSRLDGSGNHYKVDNITMKTPSDPTKDNIALLHTTGAIFATIHQQWTGIYHDILKDVEGGVNLTVCGWGEHKVSIFFPIFQNLNRVLF